MITEIIVLHKWSLRHFLTSTINVKLAINKKHERILNISI